jgi:hypothetical protein
VQVNDLVSQLRWMSTEWSTDPEFRAAAALIAAAADHIELLRQQVESRPCKYFSCAGGEDA